MEKQEIYEMLDKVMFNEQKRMSHRDIILFLLDFYWQSKAKTPEQEQITLDQIVSLPKKQAAKKEKAFRVQLIRKGSLTPSLKGTGYYTRHTFKDLEKNTLYILDVSSYTNIVYKTLEIGDVLENPETFSRGNKNYLNGKKTAKYIGHINDIKSKTPAATKKNILDL